MESLALSKLAVAPDIRSAIAGQFRGLWALSSLQESLDRLCRAIAEIGFWRDGWVAVRQTLKYDSKGMKKGALEGVRLQKQVDESRKYETRQDKARNERFE